MDFSEILMIMYADGREEAKTALPAAIGADRDLVSTMDQSSHMFGPIAGTAWDSDKEGDPRKVLSLLGDAYSLLVRHVDNGYGHVINPAGRWMRSSFCIAKALARGMDSSADAYECAAMLAFNGDRTMDSVIRAAGGYCFMYPVINAFGTDCVSVTVDDCDPLARGFITWLAGGKWLDSWNRDRHHQHRPRHSTNLSQSALGNGLEMLMERAALINDEKRGWRRTLGSSACAIAHETWLKTNRQAEKEQMITEAIICMMAALNGLDDHMLMLIFKTYMDADTKGKACMINSLTGLYVHDLMLGKPFSMTIPDREMPDAFISECLLAGYAGA